LYPLLGFPNPAISEASERLIKDHQSKYAQNSRILQQRQTVELIPITKVKYKWKGDSHKYLVYGNEHKHRPPPPVLPGSSPSRAGPRCSASRCLCSEAPHKDDKREKKKKKKKREKKKKKHPVAAALSCVNIDPVSTNRRAALRPGPRLHGGAAEWSEDRQVDDVQMTQSNCADIAG
ncbi:unnamed protein product, partial [Pleuronectes platessa]